MAITTAAMFAAGVVMFVVQTPAAAAIEAHTCRTSAVRCAGVWLWGLDRPNHHCATAESGIMLVLTALLTWLEQAGRRFAPGVRWHPAGLR